MAWFGVADMDAASRQWQEEFVRTLLERDMPQLGITIPAAALGRFWTMLNPASKCTRHSCATLKT